MRLIIEIDDTEYNKIINQENYGEDEPTYIDVIRKGIPRKEINMDTNFHMLRSFVYNPEHKGWCTDREVKQIENHFHIKERTDTELQNLRDFAVMYYSERSRIAREKGNDKESWNIMDTMSAVTGIIDHHKFNRGMEV